MGDHDELKKEMSTISDSLRELAATVNNLSTKFDDMAAKAERLSPLAPVAARLADLPEKVLNLQAAAFENTEQVRALNLALIRVESSQREGKAHAATDEEEAIDSNTDPQRRGHRPPPRTERPPPRQDTPFTSPGGVSSGSWSWQVGTEILWSFSSIGADWRCRLSVGIASWCSAAQCVSCGLAETVLW
jgi:hypothetical protein